MLERIDIQVYKQLKKMTKYTSGHLVIVMSVSFFAACAILAENESVVKRTRTSEIIAVFNNLANIAVASAIVDYISKAPKRKKQRQYEAWQAIDIASINPESTSLARINSIEYLNRDQVPFRHLNMKGARLDCINLRSARFNDVDFRSSSLINADLSHSSIIRANFSGADLSGANLSNSKIVDCNFEHAKLKFAKVDNATIIDTNLFKVNFRNASLKNSDLNGSDISEALLVYTDLTDVKNIREDQFFGDSCPLLCRASLPSQFLKVDPNRDCEYLEEKGKIIPRNIADLADLDK